MQCWVAVTVSVGTGTVSGRVRDCLGSGPGPCRVGSGTVPGGRGVEGWCGGTGWHSGISGRYSVGMARHRHGMARKCHRHSKTTSMLELVAVASPPRAAEKEGTLLPKVQNRTKIVIRHKTI